MIFYCIRKKQHLRKEEWSFTVSERNSIWERRNDLLLYQKERVRELEKASLQQVTDHRQKTMDGEGALSLLLRKNASIWFINCLQKVEARKREAEREGEKESVCEGVGGGEKERDRDTETGTERVTVHCESMIPPKPWIQKHRKWQQTPQEDLWNLFTS